MPGYDDLAFLPTTADELRARGQDEVDVVFVTGDAYVDHPSFAMALLGRVLEAAGFRVAILSQPDWRSADPWRELGRPRLFYAVSAGNMDSMINHYTANRKRRNQDAYSPGGRIELRPDRPTNVYAQRCREAFPGVPVVIGGVEASLRRIAHFDYWSDTVRPSMLVTSKADLLAFGMGEDAIATIARRLAAGEDVKALRDMRGVAYLLGKNEELPDHRFDDASCDNVTRSMPSFEDVREGGRPFAEMTRTLHHETNPLNARRLTQRHGDRTLVLNPPTLPLSRERMDAIYDLPYTRRQHPRYDEPVPAHAMIKDSVTIMRGCFGGCTFCSITMHQGRAIQSRSQDSIVREVEQMAADPEFKGVVSDLGGPTANMYEMRCSKPEVEAVCRRLSCIHPTVCKLLDTSHKPNLELLRKARAVPGVKKVHVASGIRMDLAREDPEYLEELAEHHVGGHLKVAPEAVSDKVLNLMKKPANHTFEEFSDRFEAASKRVGKEQYLVPYFIASHPGSTVEDMIDLAVFLKQRGYKPRQVQDFIPAPMDIATCMYFTGLDPMTMKPVETVKRLQDRQTQRALMQFFKPENWFTVRKALLGAGRADLIGNGPLCLIRETPPKEALEARRQDANREPRSTSKARAPRRGTGKRPGPHPGPAKGRRGGFARVGLVFASTLLALGLAEVAARVLLRSEPSIRFTQNHDQLELGGWQSSGAVIEDDPELFWRLIPDTTLPETEFPMRGVVANSQGLREDHEIPPRTSADEIRILFLGDSCTFGSGLLPEQGFVERTERLLRRRFPDRPVEAINAGVPGYSLFQGWRFLETRGFGFEPDLVVVTFGWNGYVAWDGASDLEHYAAVRASQPPAALHWSRLSRMVWAALRAPAPAPVEDPARTGRSRLSAAEYRQLLQSVHDASRARGIDVLFAVWPAPFNIDPAKSAELRSELQVETYAYGRDLTFEDDGAELLDLVPVARALAATRPASDVFIDHIHGTSVANERFAEAFADVLEARLRARAPRQAGSSRPR